MTEYSMWFLVFSKFDKSMTMEDTEWNDILREKGIITEQQVVEMVDEIVDQKAKQDDDGLSDKSLSELDALEDELDDRVLESYRYQPSTMLILKLLYTK